MSKMIKLYRLNLEAATGLNIAAFNPTCKAILKTMYKIEKENIDDQSFQGSTGDYILQQAVKRGLWFTRQAPEKYHTTWAYYVKLLKEKAGVTESGASVSLSTEEYLDEEEFLDDVISGPIDASEQVSDEPSEEEPADFEEDTDEEAEVVHEDSESEDEELQRMIAEELAEKEANAHLMAAE